MIRAIRIMFAVHQLGRIATRQLFAGQTVGPAFVSTAVQKPANVAE
jgi:hypothetical protein